MENIGTLIYYIVELVIFSGMAFMFIFKSEKMMTLILKKYDDKTKLLSYLIGVISISMIISSIVHIIQYIS